MRKRIGYRRHRATFQRHDGTQDKHGQPTYGDAAAWRTVVKRWPCELVATTGGETLRGRQVTATATHVLFGEYHAAADVEADMRCNIDGVRYAVVANYDQIGDRRELRVEVRQES